MMTTLFCYGVTSGYMRLPCMSGGPDNHPSRYIRRQDGSPLMDALITWRQTALHDQRSLLSSRPTSPSPLSEDESVKSEGDEPSEERRPQRSKTDSSLTVDGAGKEPAPTSSSWVRWWSRSRRADAARPEIGHTNSEPSTVPKVRAYLLVI